MLMQMTWTMNFVGVANNPPINRYNPYPSLQAHIWIRYDLGARMATCVHSPKLWSFQFLLLLGKPGV